MSWDMVSTKSWNRTPAERAIYTQVGRRSCHHSDSGRVPRAQIGHIVLSSTIAATRSAAALAVAGRTWLYRSAVIEMPACPRLELTVFKSIPATSAREAALWRRSCRRIRGKPAGENTVPGVLVRRADHERNLHNRYRPGRMAKRRVFGKSNTSNRY
jgi:hypothetical protein